MSKRRFLISLLTGVCLVLLYLLCCGFFREEVPSERLRMGSDAFFLVGITFLSVGVLLFVRKHGGFDGLSYGLHRVKGALSFGARQEQAESYGDYLLREREKERASGTTLMLSALLFLAVAGVCAFLYG